MIGKAAIHVMTDETTQISALARKLDRADTAERNAARPIPRALRLSLARVAAASLDLAMSVIGINETLCDEDGLRDCFGGDRLYLLLRGAEDAIGAISVDRVCVTALMQQQTVGKVETVSPGDRAFTATDAAMTVPLCELWFAAADRLLAEAGECPVFDGFSTPRPVQTQRELMLAAPPGEYHVFQITTDIANGTCQGQLTLVLPKPSDPVAGAEDVPDQMQPTLGDSAGVIRANLRAVLSRVRLPLQSFAAMKPGDVVPLDGCRLDETELLSIEGKKVAHARLGQSRGMRAVRLNEAEPEVEIEEEPAPFLDHAMPRPEPRDLTAPGLAAEGDAQAGTITGVVEPDMDTDAMSPLLAGTSRMEAEISELAGLAQTTGAPGQPLESGGHE